MGLEELKVNTLDKVVEYLENYNTKYSQFDEEVVREFDEVVVGDISNIIDTYLHEKNVMLGIEVEDTDFGISDFFNEEVEEDEFNIEQYSGVDTDVTDIVDEVEKQEEDIESNLGIKEEEYEDILNELDSSNLEMDDVDLKDLFDK